MSKPPPTGRSTPARSTDPGGMVSPESSVEGRLGATGDQTGVRATISKGGGAYEQADCVLRYHSAFQGIAAGRAWGELTCSDATKTGTPARVSCKAIAELRLENCEQE